MGGMEAVDRFHEIPALMKESQTAWREARGRAAREVLEAFGGNKTKAAKAVGIGRGNFLKILDY